MRETPQKGWRKRIENPQKKIDDLGGPTPPRFSETSKLYWLVKKDPYNGLL